MSKEICDVIDKLAEKIGIAVDWSNENVLPYIQGLIVRYSKYEIATYTIWCIVSFILTVCSVVGIVWSCRKIKKKNLVLKEHPDIQCDEVVETVTVVFSILGLLLFGILLCCFSDMLMQWVFIPDISFMKTITTMIK